MNYDFWIEGGLWIAFKKNRYKENLRKIRFLLDAMTFIVQENSSLKSFFFQFWYFLFYPTKEPTK